MQHIAHDIDETVSTRRMSPPKKLNSVQTHDLLKGALAGKDLNVFQTVTVDRREAAKFIERQTKILRFVSMSAGLPTITSLIEQIYYAAFDQSLVKKYPDLAEFRSLMHSEVKERKPNR
jgi:hypothetical protein